MSRPSLRQQRRAQIARALARVLGKHGQGRATVAAITAEATVAPGLFHHYFEDKQDLYQTMLDELLAGFRARLEARRGEEPLVAYVNAALSLDTRSDTVSARAWVGLLAEALGHPALFDKVRRALDAEVAHVERRSGGTLSTADAGAVVAFVVGALVFGAFAPRRVAGFAAPSLLRMLPALRRRP